MTYKTILVQLDSSRRCAERVAFAATWAKAHGGHLVGLVPTGLYDGVIPAEAVVSGPSDFMARSADFLRERAERISREFHRQLGDEVSHEVRVVDDLAIDAVVRHGRSSDLVIVGQHDADDPQSAPVLADLPQRVLVEVGAPVLVFPYAGRFDHLPQRAVLAWNGTRECAMAVRAAIPALQRAGSVTVVSYGPPEQRRDEPDSLLVRRLLQYLQRHGVQARAEHDVTGIDVGNTLLSRLADMDADLLVMGGYGHARLRELVLGGVTRHILGSMTVPVLMAH